MGPKVTSIESGKVNSNPISMEQAHAHFTSLLTRSGTATEEVNNYLPDQQEVDASLQEEFTMIELGIALKSMKANKATGEDGISAETLQYGGAEIRQELLNLYNRALKEGQLPKALKDARMVLLYKSGDKSSCNNHRGITLLSHSGKILERMILNRVMSNIISKEGCVPDTQFGFMPDRGTADAIFMSRGLAAHTLSMENGRLVRCYIDLTKAYDRVDRDVMWELLRRYGIPVV